MENHYTEISKISYGQKVKRSFGGMIFGVIFFLGSFALLWFNEGRNVRLIQEEDFINKNAVVVKSDTVNRSNDAKLIAVSGKVHTDETLSDSLISVDKALSLSRMVEMYQWVEKKNIQERRDAGGGSIKTTTYSYEKRWDRIEHNSDKYKKPGYNNPKFSFEEKELNAESALMGQFKITGSQLARMRDSKKIERLKPIEGFQIVDHYYYKGNDISSPEIGDIRISYEYVPSGAGLSIIGQQNGDDTIGEMATRNGSVYLQYDGFHSLDQMLSKFKRSNTLWAFVLRFVGFLIMFLGLQILISPIVTIARFVPFLSEIVEFVSSYVLGLIAFVLSMLTIAIAWFVYRPLLSISLLLLIGMLMYYIKDYLRKKKDTLPVSQR